jgi:hypothetical protein
MDHGDHVALIRDGLDGSGPALIRPAATPSAQASVEILGGCDAS